MTKKRPGRKRNNETNFTQLKTENSYEQLNIHTKERSNIARRQQQQFQLLEILNSFYTQTHFKVLS